MNAPLLRDPASTDLRAPNGQKIVTTFWRKPIPTNAYDWVATLDDYDGAPDAGPQAVGYGPTEEVAVQRLLESIEELEDI